MTTLHARRTLSTGRARPVIVAMAVIAAAPCAAQTFSSGSTGADGAFNPTVSGPVDLPASGVFHFTTVNVPVGVTVTFRRNAGNTPVVILATGAVNIQGSVSVNGGAAPGFIGGAQLPSIGEPGRGGPGGFDGGRGGAVTGIQRGGAGLGPGGGMGGDIFDSGALNPTFGFGGGGGFGVAGFNGQNHDAAKTGSAGMGGVAYGSPALLPLIGGSGGGGGAGGVFTTGGSKQAFSGGGGGGGGGAILIASSVQIVVNGPGISAIGGNGGDASFTCGGGGSGGAIRLVAPVIQVPSPVLYALGGSCGLLGGSNPGRGAVGRIRIEAINSSVSTAGMTPPPSVAAPGPVFVAGLPTLAITRIGGQDVPAPPTGNADVTLPSSTTNPVEVLLTTNGIPLGNTATVFVTPARGGEPGSFTSTALAGSLSGATATASVNLPPGSSTVSASVSYTVTLAQGEALSRYADNERVERMTLTATLTGTSEVTLTTVSGRRYDIPLARFAQFGG